MHFYCQCLQILCFTFTQYSIDIQEWVDLGWFLLKSCEQVGCGCSLSYHVTRVDLLGQLVVKYKIIQNINPISVDYTDFNNVYTFVVNRCKYTIYNAKMGLLPQNEIKQKTELSWLSFGE